MNRKIKIGVLHGARSNAGDFLIYKRGRELLESFFGDDFDFAYKLRSEPITHGDWDGLIVLGGPLISRRLHIHSRNIRQYIESMGKSMPIFCIGLGIAGEKFDSARNYFLDDESISFWKYVYQTSGLFSVRDKVTYNVLNNYGIYAELTGCPSLFDLEILEGRKTEEKNDRTDKIAVTIPYLSFSPFSAVASVKGFLLTLLFLLAMKKRFKNSKELGVFFQHGYDNLGNKAMQKLANMFGIKTYDFSGKSLDSAELRQYDVCIGPRLHSHIYFLSSNKASFLFNVDMRTEAFLKTIETPSGKYTISGIKNLVKTLADRVGENNFDEFNNVSGEIAKFYVVMKNFLNKIVLFWESNAYESNRNRQ